MRTALFSAFNKTEKLAVLARELKARGWEILASSGTTKFFAQQGIESLDVATIVGEPILGHRVVTLSREIYAGLLARPEDEQELDKLRVRKIDLVFVDLYPLEEEIAKTDATEQSVIDKTDIGGPTLLRAAAKGRRIVLTSENQFDDALAYLDGKMMDEKFLTKLAANAEFVVSAYAKSSAEYLAKISG